MQQTSVLYDPRAAATSEGLKQVLSLRAARARIAGAAKIYNSAPSMTDPPKERIRPRETVKELLPIPKEAFSEAHFICDSILRAGWCQVESIQRLVLRDFPNLTIADLKAPRRDAAVIRARQIAMYLAKTLTARSFPDVGRRFGGRDHTTVLHAVRKIEALLHVDPDLFAQIERIKATHAELVACNFSKDSNNG